MCWDNMTRGVFVTDYGKILNRTQAGVGGGDHRYSWMIRLGWKRIRVFNYLTFSGCAAAAH